MKKLIAFLGIVVAVSATAETSAWFVGGQASLAQHKSSVELDGWRIQLVGSSFDNTDTGLKIGILGGYKQFFTPEFGLRYYAKYSRGNSYNTLDANVDAMYDFGEDASFGVFAGLGLGLASYTQATAKTGFDYAINLGVRWLLGEKHSLEGFGRIGLSEHKETVAQSFIYKDSQPFEVGIRYIFSF